MKINHAKFGVIEVTPEELVKMEMLMEGMKPTQTKKSVPNGSTYTKFQGVGRGKALIQNSFTEEEINFILDNMHLGPMLVAKSPMLKRHSINSSRTYVMKMRVGNVKTMSAIAAKLYKDWMAKKGNKNETTAREYLKPVSAYTED
jgi:hypothetical protein